MKVAELKDELEARDEARSGNKAWLRRRLHTHCDCARISGGRHEGRGGVGDPHFFARLRRANFYTFTVIPNFLYRVHFYAFMAKTPNKLLQNPHPMACGKWGNRGESSCNMSTI